MPKPTDPSIPTIKRLFAVSSNRCAFPSCTSPLVVDGEIVAEICHIEAASPGGKRYNVAQTDNDRRNFSNLVIMCPTHHTVIDADDRSYTVERLKEIKVDHEQGSVPVEELADTVATQFITNITGNNPTNGSIVTSIGQMGGQTAHSITNLGLPARTFSPAVRERLLGLLRTDTPQAVSISTTTPSGEPLAFANQILSLFQAAGWTIEPNEVTTVFVGTEIPLHVIMRESNPSLAAFATALDGSGFAAGGYIGDLASETPEIRVGSQ